MMSITQQIKTGKGKDRMESQTDRQTDRQTNAVIAF